MLQLYKLIINLKNFSENVEKWFKNDKNLFKCINFKIKIKLKITLFNKSIILNQIKWTKKSAIFNKLKNNRD